MFFKPNAPAAVPAGKTLIGFNWIGGKETEGDLPSFESRSPVDRRDTVGVFPECGERDVERAAKAAAEAFKSWSRLPMPHRGEFLRQVGERLHQHQERLVRVLVREVGKTPREALGEVQEAIDLCSFYAAEGHRPMGQLLPSGRWHKRLTVRRRPQGVCAVMTPCNFPLAIPLWKLLPALLCGNTVVWKPSEDAPSIAYVLTRAFMDAGLPGGVLNVVHGRGAGGVGQHLIAGIDRGLFQQMSFTGSTAVGRAIGEACGRNLIAPSLSLSAKNPMVVMADADLEQAVQGALYGAFSMAGQRCTSIGNLILHRPIAEAFKARFLEAVSRLTVGNPLEDPEVFYGPLISARLAKAFEEHWEWGRAEGATLLCGGAMWTEENRSSNVVGHIAHGLYPQPCVWEGVTPEMKLFRHEILGPTVNLTVVETFDEALALVHATPYGLAASLYTQEPSWIARFEDEVGVGMVSINDSTVGAEPHQPFGGMGWSGNGRRDGGAWALENYSHWQVLNDNPKGHPDGMHGEASTSHPRATYDRTHWDQL